MREPYVLTMDSPLGPLQLRSDGTHLTHILFIDSGDASVEGRSCGCLEAAAEQLAAYFTGARQTFELALAPAGTPFQQEVWEVLRGIPWGETVSYSELAARLGRPEAVRAVGAANGRNPLAIVVPCHRVIGADGTLVGYAGGLERKRALLRLEGLEVPEQGSLFS